MAQFLTAGSDYNSNLVVSSLGESFVSVLDLLQDHAYRRPGAVAISWNGSDLSYSELERKSSALASHLLKIGIEREERVAICLTRTPLLIVSILGVLKAGAAYVPIDPSYPEERVQYILEDAQIGIILTEDGVRMPEGGSGASSIQVDTLELENENVQLRPMVRAGSQLAYVIYTSGSTGKPKGVMVEHASLAHYVLHASELYELRETDRCLQFSSICFDASIEEIFCPLISGSAIVLRNEEMARSAYDFFEFCKNQRITVLALPTAFFHQLGARLNGSDCSVPPSIRLIILGGEKVLLENVKLWLKQTHSGVRLVNTYGPTECTVAATFFEIPRDAAQRLQDVPIGTPLPGIEIYLLDDKGNIVAADESGELCIGGGCLARGYLNRTELTSEKFVFLPGKEERRIYRTGDLAKRLPCGNLAFLGRLDHQVKIRGFRIELGEIENILLGIESVEQAVVVTEEEIPGQPKLLAILVATTSLTEEQIREQLRKKLPDYMLPSRIQFVEQIPLTANGKIDLKKLRTRAKTSVVEVEQKPESVLELRIFHAFKRVLRKEPASLDESFFALGGDSLQALELLCELQNLTPVRLPPDSIYRASSIRGLAGLLETFHETETASILTALQPQGKARPLYFFHTTPGDVLGYGNLIYHLGGGQPCYGLQSLGLLEIAKAHLSIPKMAQCYTELLMEHNPGPYQLLGWCYGGILAQETARLLISRGREVSFLGLIETPAPRSQGSSWRYFYNRLRAAARLSPAGLAGYLSEKVRYYSSLQEENEKRYTRMPAKTDISDELARERNHYLDKLETLYRLNVKALHQFRARPTQTKIHLFNATERDPAQLPDPFYGWGGLADELQVHLTEGDHNSILQEPLVKMLAETIRSALNK